MHLVSTTPGKYKNFPCICQSDEFKIPIFAVGTNANIIIKYILRRQIYVKFQSGPSNNVQTRAIVRTCLE